MEKSLENDMLRNELKVADEQCKKSVEILKNELLIITKERDKLMAQIEEQQSPEVEVDLCGENYDDNLLKAKAEVEELTGRLSRLEAKMRSTIESSPCGDNCEGGAVNLSQLNLIDLAGSESSKAETTGVRRKEGSYINKSLLTLGTVGSRH